MRIFKVIIGLACIIAATPSGLLAVMCYSNLGTVKPGSSFLGASVISIFAISLAGAGWFLIARRNSRISKITAVMTVVAIIAGVFPTAWVLTHPVESRYRAGEARWQLQQLDLAIRLYKEEYGRFPISTNITTVNSNDFTFGTWNTSVSSLGITNAVGPQANNSEIISILMAWTNCPDFTKAIVSIEKYEFPSIGKDGVLRDPWGYPYIITLDLNGDNKCRDAFYRLASVSEIDSGTQGLNELTRPTSPPYRSPEARDSFEAPDIVMLWSLGPRGKADRLKKANVGVNKDHILRVLHSWE